MEGNSTMVISATVPGQLGGFNLSKRFLKVQWITQLTGNGTTEPPVVVKKISTLGLLTDTMDSPQQPPLAAPSAAMLPSNLNENTQERCGASLHYLGLSENRVYSQTNSHLIGIMISKTIGFRGTLFSDTPT